MHLLESLRSGIEDGLTYRVEGQTLVLRMSTAHHGLHSRTFRIRLVQNGLQIVAVSQQSLEFTDDGREAWSGSLVDLASSRAEVWQTISPIDSPQDRRALQARQAAFERDSPPTQGTRYAIRLQHARPQPLARLRESSPDGLYVCAYIDANDRLRSLDDPHCLK